MRRISTGGMLGGPQQKALSVGAQAMPVIEQAPVMEIESDESLRMPAGISLCIIGIANDDYDAWLAHIEAR
jgi:hypothetical protein